jgi:hypothetical protein
MNNVPRPELRMLLYCARTCVDAQGASQIKSLVEKDIEWTYLVGTALAHGVMPLLYRSLHATCPNAVPKAILEQLREHFYANAGHNLFLAKELLKLLHLLEAHEIPAIPYKGPLLAATIYGNLALREFGDLDILVRERDYQRAQHLLVDQGFRLTIEHEWEAEFTDEYGKVAVDLHRRIAPQEFPSPLTFEYLSKRLQPTTLIGTTVPSLSPKDTLFMLSIQVTKDRFLKLAKVCDVAELLRMHPGLNWAQALTEAKRLGAQRKILFALCLTSNLLGTPLPQEVVREVRFHSFIHELVKHASQQLFHQKDDTVGDHLTVQRSDWVVRERLRDKLYPYYLGYVHDVIVPNELDRRLLPLPRQISFLYYFIRPVRLVVKYALLLLRRVTPLPRNHDLATDNKKTVVGGGASVNKSYS